MPLLLVTLQSWTLCEAVNEILAWSGDATFRYWTMLFGLGGWVPTGRGWIEKWNTDFEWHRISDVSRDIRSMAEDWKVNLQSGLSDWEVILCGPRDETGTCGWLDEPNFDFIVEYSLDYVLICKFSIGHHTLIQFWETSSEIDLETLSTIFKDQLRTILLAHPYGPYGLSNSLLEMWTDWKSYEAEVVLEGLSKLYQRVSLLISEIPKLSPNNFCFTKT